MNKKGLLLGMLLVITSLVLVSCDGKETTPVEEATSPMEEAPAEEQGEMNTTGASFEEQELPNDFPEEFPIPDYAKVGSTEPMPGKDSFRIFLAYPEVTLEELLAYYLNELQVLGWTVDSEGDSALGHKMEISNPDYEAKLDFIKDEYGVVLDLAIAPLGELMEIPFSGEAYEESESLGEKTGDIPADFPKPATFTIIDLPPKLAGEGYQLAFTFPNMAELAIIELSTALVSAGWEIGTYEIGSGGEFYTMPFSSSSGFHGYALITAKADLAGLDSISGSVIALHPENVP